MLINRIEREVKSSPIFIGRRIMTTEGIEDELEAGPSTSQQVPPTAPSSAFSVLTNNVLCAFQKNGKDQNRTMQDPNTCFRVSYVPF